MTEPVSDEQLAGIREHIQKIHDGYRAESASAAEVSLDMDIEMLLDAHDRLRAENERLRDRSERLFVESEALRIGSKRLRDDSVRLRAEGLFSPRRGRGAER